jgi:hypothetical protein
MLEQVTPTNSASAPRATRLCARRQSASAPSPLRADREDDDRHAHRDA